MGDLQTDQGEALELQFVPVDEFSRLLDARIPDVARAHAFAALARINTLYMIAGAWSGHIGTSFSSLEIMSWGRRKLSTMVMYPASGTTGRQVCSSWPVPEMVMFMLC